MPFSDLMTTLTYSTFILYGLFALNPKKRNQFIAIGRNRNANPPKSEKEVSNMNALQKSEQITTKLDIRTYEDRILSYAPVS